MKEYIDITLTDDAGTISAMEWLRDNEWPDAEIIMFHSQSGRFRFCCSKVDEIPITFLEHGAAQYKGMKRYRSSENSWYLTINNQSYFLSR